VFCDRCEADLEVTSTNPLELDWIDNLVDSSRTQDLEVELTSV